MNNRISEAYNELMQVVKNSYYRYVYFESFIPRKGFHFTKIAFINGRIKFFKIPYSEVYL